MLESVCSIQFDMAPVKPENVVSKRTPDYFL